MIVIAIEGVLAEPGTDWVLSSNALPLGRKIYDGLVDQSRVVLLSSESHPDRYRSWLLKERFRRFSEIHHWPVDSPVPVLEWKLDVLRKLVSVSPIDFFIDTDPTAVRLALEEGIPSMLVAYPSTFPGERPTGPYKPWDELVDTIEAQTTIKAARGLSAGV